MVIIYHLKSPTTISGTEQFDFGNPFWWRSRSEEISPPSLDLEMGDKCHSLYFSQWWPSHTGDMYIASRPQEWLAFQATYVACCIYICCNQVFKWHMLQANVYFVTCQRTPWLCIFFHFCILPASRTKTAFRVNHLNEHHHQDRRPPDDGAQWDLITKRMKRSKLI